MTTILTTEQVAELKGELEDGRSNDAVLAIWCEDHGRDLIASHEALRAEVGELSGKLELAEILIETNKTIEVPDLEKQLAGAREEIKRLKEDLDFATGKFRDFC